MRRRGEEVWGVGCDDEDDEDEAREEDASYNACVKSYRRLVPNFA